MPNKIAQKIMESFKGMLPENQTQAVEQAINEFVQQTEQKIKTDYEKTLEESYKEWDHQLKEAKEEGEKKLKEAEAVAYEGYDEAKTLIEQKEEAIQTQKTEFEDFLTEQYKQAKEMIDSEKSRNDQIEQDLYEAYTQQVEDVKDDLVNKIDSFLGEKVEEIAEAVRKELRNSPEVLESKVAYERIKTIVAESLSPTQLHAQSNDKIDALQDSMDQMKNELKALKAKNMRLVTENQNYEKTLRESNENNTDTRLQEVRRDTERRVAERIAENVEGRGKIVSQEDLITENAADVKKVTPANTAEFDEMEVYKKLSGLIK